MLIAFIADFVDKNFASLYLHFKFFSRFSIQLFFFFLSGNKFEKLCLAFGQCRIRLKEFLLVIAYRVLWVADIVSYFTFLFLHRRMLHFLFLLSC